MPAPRSPADMVKVRAAFARLPGTTSNRDIAAKTGLSDSSISAYRNGWRTPSAGNLIKLAQAMNVDVRELMTDPTAA